MEYSINDNKNKTYSENKNAETLLSGYSLNKNTRYDKYGGPCEPCKINLETEIRNIYETYVHSDSENSDQQNNDSPRGPLTLPLHVYNDNLGLRNETHIEQSGSVTHKVIYTKSMMMDTSTVNENNDTNLHTEDENNNLTRNVQNLSNFCEAEFLTQPDLQQANLNELHETKSDDKMSFKLGF